MKIKSWILIGACTVLLTGCGGSLPEMTDEQVDAIGEYAAVTLLKYDANSKSRLVDPARLAEAEQAAKQQKTKPTEEQKTDPQPEQNQGKQSEQGNLTVVDRTGSGATLKADSLEGFFGLQGSVKLSYTGYDVQKSFGEANSYFALDATEGKELLILHFALENISGQEQTVRFIDQTASYRVTVNGSYTRTALTTLLDNNLATYIGKLQPDETTDVVILIEIEQEQAAEINSVNLILKNEQESYTIQLK
ncbi:MAG: hypothetical protein IJ747_00470 [Lachnospiraceae bacterium]|nr:hypothetical protein [Lachnospiraceae bacterium]